MSKELSAAPSPGSLENEFHCRCCGQLACSETFNVRECDLGIGTWHLYGRCAVCRAISILEVPIDLNRYYASENYYSLQNSDAGKAVETNWKARLLRKAYFGRGPVWSFFAKAIQASLKYSHLHSTLQISRMARLGDNATVLDIGCGTKTAFDPLRGLGFSSIDGCDPFIQGTIHRDFGTIYQSQIHDLKPDRPYDLVLFSHSLEHTEDAVSQLNAARQLIKDTGRIAILIPMGDCAEISMYGASSTLFEAPRHLFLPSRQSMQHMINECHLSIVETTWLQSMNTLQRSEFIRQQPENVLINLSQPDLDIESQIPALKKEELLQMRNKWHGDTSAAAVGLYILKKKSDH